MRRVPSLAGLLYLFIISIPAISCGNVDVVTASYATLDEARREGAVERGWIPEGLPAGTHEIREAHDLDSNRRWGLFSFRPEDSATLKQLLKADEKPLSGVRADAPPRIEWWPVLLRGALDAESIAATGLRAYGSVDERLIFLVNWQQCRAYYWSLPPHS